MLRFLAQTLVFLTLCIQITAHAVPVVERGLSTRWSFRRFQVAASYLTQDFQGAVPTLEISWRPEVRLSDNVKLIANLGVMPINVGVGDTFAAFETAGLFSISSEGAIYPEVGGGAQYWPQHGGFAPEVTANIVFGFHLYRLKHFVVRRLAFGYSQVFFYDNVHQYKAIVELNF